MPSGLVKHRDHLNVLGCLAAIAAKHWRSTVAVLANKNLFVQCNVIISMGYALICVNLSHGSPRLHATAYSANMVWRFLPLESFGSFPFFASFFSLVNNLTGIESMLWHWCSGGINGPTGHKICQRVFETSFKTKCELLLLAQNPCNMRNHNGSLHLHVVTAFEWSCILCLQNRCWDVVHVCACIVEQVLVGHPYSFIFAVSSVSANAAQQLHEACPKLARFWIRSMFSNINSIKD